MSGSSKAKTAKVDKMTKMDRSDKKSSDQVMQTSFITSQFNDAKKRKWEIGRVKYGDKFVGHPLLHAYEEVIDLSNYIDHALEAGVITKSEWEDNQASIKLVAMRLKVIWHNLEMKRREKAGEVRPV